MARTKVTIEKDNRPCRQKIWLVRWHGLYDPATGTQKHHSKSFVTKKEAERFAEQLNQEFETGMPRDPQDITLKELCDKFLITKEKKIVDGSIKLYKESFRRLLDYFGPTTSPKRITQEQAEEFDAHIDFIHPLHINRSKEPSSSLRNRILRNCKTLFNKALEWHYIRYNPFNKIEQENCIQHPWHFFSPEEFLSILIKTKNVRAKGLYAVMYGCGLRLGEAVNLLNNGTDIDFSNNKITVVNRKGTTDIPPFTIKDKQSRSVSMPNWVSKIIVQVQEQADEGCPFMFLSRDRYEYVKNKWHKYRNSGKEEKWQNKNMANNVLRDFKVKVRKAGIKGTGKITIHCLRKSWASNLANAGVPPHTLMKMGGWSDIETVLKHYLKSSDENEKKAVEILDRLMEREVVEVGVTITY